MICRALLGRWNHLHPDLYYQILMIIINSHSWGLWVSWTFIGYMTLILFSN